MKSFILYHHLGLGDHIICNGLVNFLSYKYEKIYLPVNINLMNQIEYLYSQNSKIKLLPLNLKKNNETDLVNDYSKKLNLEILKVGFESRVNQKLPFYKSFYNQLGLRYNISYKYFFCPSNSQKEDELYCHLTSLFKIEKNDYILVHDEASNEKCELEIDSDKDVISLSSEYDIFNNIFLYKKLV